MSAVSAPLTIGRAGRHGDLVVAVDIGGTKVAAGLVTSVGRVLHKVVGPTQTGSRTTGEAVFDGIARTLAALLDRAGSAEVVAASRALRHRRPARGAQKMTAEDKRARAGLPDDGLRRAEHYAAVDWPRGGLRRGRDRDPYAQTRTRGTEDARGPVRISGERDLCQARRAGARRRRGRDA